MIFEFLKFFANGGFLGIIAWALQQAIYYVLGGDTPEKYAIASALTYVPLVVVNFVIQRRWIFKTSGLFPRFLIANLLIMLLISALSPICRQAVNLVLGPPWGSHLGFIFAALLGSIPSFLIKRYWVFRKHIKNH
ncbi:MAG TPA: hypothetical protein DIS96_09545 [Pusillimonas sp.]|nr:hypothetical protein [Pusillimonas sp.]|tara:strand:- start:239 stop:643 length:405 start_codon:yes stop_codon:yes gene_type:complete